MGEERRRHLHVGAAALQDGRGEAGEVADHAAAEGDDMIAPLDAEPEQPLDQRLEVRPALGRLAGPHDHRLDAEL